MCMNRCENMDFMYGHCYTPNQIYKTIYSPEQGLMKGTMFPELVSNYVPNQALATINYLKKSNKGGYLNGMR